MPTGKLATLVVKGLKLSYYDIGPADPAGVIVLLPGVGDNKLHWHKQFSAFSERYRLIALDYRDAGDSDLSPVAYTTIDQAEDLAELLNELGITRVTLIGHSMGGGVALKFAARHGDSVDKLILVDTLAGNLGFDIPDKPLVPADPAGYAAMVKEGFIGAAGPEYAGNHPEEVDLYVAISSSKQQSNAAYARQWSTIQSYVRSGGGMTLEQLSNIKVPTLVIHGEADRNLPIDWGRYIAQSIPGAQFISYPGVGHYANIECTETFNKDILVFLG